MRINPILNAAAQPKLVISLSPYLEDEIKQRVQVLRTRTRHEDVGVAEPHGRRDRQPQRRRLAPPPRRRQRHRPVQLLVRDGVHELEEGLGLVEGLALAEEDAGGLGVGELVLDLAQLGLLGGEGVLGGLGGQLGEVLDVRGEREDVELVVQDDAVSRNSGLEAEGP